MKTAGYSIAHCAVDFCCAYLLIGSLSESDLWMEIMLLYNFAAFALQMPIGMLADRLNRNHLVAAVGMVLVAASFLMGRFPLVCALAAGFGNALFHVGSGLEILNESEKKAARLGIFVAPGALGLFLGAQGAKSGLSLWVVPLLLAVCGALLLWKKHEDTQNSPLCPPQFTPALLSIFLVVVLRSFLGFCMDFPWNTTLLSAAAVAVGTVLGKGLGGILMDQMGFLPTAIISLLPSVVLLLFPQYPVAGILGLFFFQMTMPLTLWAAAKSCKGAKGFSFGLLTFGLFLGFLPKLLGFALPTSGLFLSVGAFLSLLLIALGKRCAE